MPSMLLCQSCWKFVVCVAFSLACGEKKIVLSSSLSPIRLRLGDVLGFPTQQWLPQLFSTIKRRERHDT